MLALSTVALLVAGSNAAELRGAETERVLAKSTFKTKNTVYKREKKVASLETVTKDTLPVDSNRGYILEWTRVNSDCSGRVEYVGGLLSGSVNARPDFFEGNQATVDKATGKYSIEYSQYSDPDGKSLLGGLSTGTRDKCEHEITNKIPYDGARVYDHQGYFFGHTFLAGDYSTVSQALKGYYKEYYASKNECLLGVQPTAFSAEWIKNECYFNSANLLGGEPKHDWFKIHAFGNDHDDGAYVQYSIHNNDDCENKDPYQKAPIEKLYAPADHHYDECVLADDYNTWVKVTSYN